MAKWNVFILIAFVLTIHGCLTHKSIDMHIYYPDGKTDKGTITITYNDIGSDSESEETQLSDFNTLMDVCSSDDLLLDFVKQGVYLKERTVFEHEGQMNLKISGIFENLMIEDNNLVREDQFRVFYLKDDDVIPAETNGELSIMDSVTAIRWPVETTDLYIKLLNKDQSESFYSLITYYRKWKQEQN